VCLRGAGNVKSRVFLENTSVMKESDGIGKVIEEARAGMG